MDLWHFPTGSDAAPSAASLLIAATARQAASPTALVQARLAASGGAHPGGAAFEARVAAAVTIWEEQ